MPLIIITGLPCSGKTHRAQQLAAEFTSHISTDPSASCLRIQHLPSHHASADAVSEPHKAQSAQASLRDQIYTSAKEEKTARAEEYSAIKRALSKDVVVIADGLNYIKGYRYQLWCEAKAAGTRCCVIHVAAREDECRAWNNERLKAAGRKDEIDEEKSQDGATQNTSELSEMLPESHTAIYGDRIVIPASCSRSSSVDGASDDEERSKKEDTMTLKSLYLRDRALGRGEEVDKHAKPDTSPTHLPESAPDATAPASTIPPPTPSSSSAYAPSTLTSLCMRYEPPSPFSRWDTPLFTVPTTDTHPPYTPIWAALFPGPAPPPKKTVSHLHPATPLPPSHPAVPPVKPHAATVLPAASPTSALQVLESSTALVAASLLAAYRARAGARPRDGDDDDDDDDDRDGNPLTFTVDGLDCAVAIPPGLVPSQPMLQRLRRKYTSLQRGGIAHGVGVGSVLGGRQGVVEGFVEFLGREWNGE